MKHRFFRNSFKSKRKCDCNALALSFKISKDTLTWTKHHNLGKSEPIPERTVDVNDSDVY